MAQRTLADWTYIALIATCVVLAVPLVIFFAKGWWELLHTAINWTP